MSKKNFKNCIHRLTLGALTSAVLFAFTGCSTVKSVFATEDAQKEDSRPIQNPFGDYSNAGPNRTDNLNNMILRSKQGDHSVEVQLPSQDRESSELSIPVNQNRAPASIENEETPATAPLPTTKATAADREITSEFPQGAPEDDAKRRHLEGDMNLMPTAEAPTHDRSYLAALDHLKTLFRSARYEAALIQTDDLIHEYPTDPKLYEMRGTLFDRLGKSSLALNAWKQALRFNPKNESLRRFVTHREESRGLASP